MARTLVRPSTRGTLIVLGVLSASGRASAQFTTGDLYLVSTGVPNPGVNCAAPAIVRLTWTNGWRSTAIDRPSTLSGRACYDPFRQRIVACRDASTPPVLIDSDGVETFLSGSGANRFALVASRGDGKIYAWGSSQVSYFDSGGTLQSVLNAQGTGAYQFSTSGVVGAMTFDAGTNSLFFASAVAGGLTEIARVPLTASGTQVGGTPVTTTFDGSGANPGEMPVAFSRGPSGKLFLKINDVTSNTAARMCLIDPGTLAVSTFATSGFAGSAGETAGLFVPSLGQAIVLDTSNNLLRAFSPADGGSGTLVPIGIAVSGCVSGEAAQFVLIEPAVAIPTCYANCDGSTSIPVLTAADFTCFLGKFRAADPTANCDGSTGSPSLTAADFSCFLTAFRVGCP
jgi:hypothetical protein